jgi:hypothetical protein
VLVEATVAAAETAVAAAPAPAARTEWVELIESLRLDVERLRTERMKPPSVAAAARDNKGALPTPAVVPGSLPSQRAPSVADVTTKTGKQSGPAKPVQDEWGFFDPEQCGFAALLAKLDEITQVNDGA